MNYRSQYFARHPNSITKDPRFAERIEKVLNAEQHNEQTRSFLVSILDFAKTKGGLTKGQIRYFEKIESAFSDEAIAARENFNQSLTEEDWRDWKIAINFYHNNNLPYHATIVSKAVEDANFKPTKNQFNKIVKNKYAQKVIACTIAKAKYPRDSYVTIRKSIATGSRKWSSKAREIREFIDTPCIVIDHDHKPVREARNGAKRYLILPFGSKNTLDVTESDIKKFKKPL